MNGWYSHRQLVIASIVCVTMAAFIAISFMQTEMRHYREAIYMEETRKSAEEIRHSAEEARAANASKTSFLSRMSHDIRTPLNGIIGLLQINEKHPDDPGLIESNRKKILVAATASNTIMLAEASAQRFTVLAHQMTARPLPISG